MEDVTFVNSRGKKLHGVSTVVDKTAPTVIICHGYASNTESKTHLVLSKKLSELKINSFAFDFTGCGKSEGELFELTLSQGMDDLTYAYNYVKNNLQSNHIGLLGSSFSGSVAPDPASCRSPT